jgi:hypothetical protein
MFFIAMLSTGRAFRASGIAAWYALCRRVLRRWR